MHINEKRAKRRMHKTTVKKKRLAGNEHAVSTSAIKCTQSNAAQKKKNEKSKQLNDAPGILKAIKGMGKNGE